MIYWPTTHTVLLDMDGTLLDLNFDSHFWQSHLPLRYSEQRGVDLTTAKSELAVHFKASAGTINWYCIDYWTKTLGMDIALLKEEVAHLIKIHPHVIRFLDAVRASGRRAVLVTNAHQDSLALKMKQTALHHHLDQVICAHDLGLIKEDADFWKKLQTVEAFAPEHTLLIDDNLVALRSAKAYGIKHCIAIHQPDSQQPPVETAEFEALSSFATLLPIPAR